MVGQPIDHRRSHLVVGEHRAPFRKLEVRGDDETPPFVAVGDDPEQEMRALLIDRHVAPFVKGRAFGSPLARDLYPRASTAEVDPRASPPSSLRA